MPVAVVERAIGKSTPSSADASTMSVSNGASTFVVDAQDLRKLEISVALVTHLLSHACASPPPDPCHPTPE